MSKNKYTINLSLYSILCVAICSSGCCHSSLKANIENHFQMDQVMDQISQSVQRASELEGDSGPKIASVQIDFQVDSASDAKVGVPILTVPTDLSATNQHTHHISLSFQPQETTPSSAEGAKADVKEPEKDSNLVSTLRGVFRSVRNPGNGFVFQKGSVQIQCVLKNSEDATVKLPLLEPIQLGVDHSNEVIHTLTLNLEPRPKAVTTLTLPAADAIELRPNPETSPPGK